MAPTGPLSYGNTRDSFHRGGAGITPTCLPTWLQNSGTVMEKRREVTLSAAKAECTFLNFSPQKHWILEDQKWGVLYMETLTSI